MFYEAMVVDHVDEVKAKVMYYAVYVFGPHWDRLKRGVSCGPNCTYSLRGRVSSRPPDYSVKHGAELDEIEKAVRAADSAGKPLSLDDLRNLAMEKHGDDPFIVSLNGNVIG